VLLSQGIESGLSGERKVPMAGAVIWHSLAVVANSAAVHRETGRFRTRKDLSKLIFDWGIPVFVLLVSCLS